MNIIQCKICNKPFQSIGNRTCPDCLAKMDREFITVRDYIYDNPNSRIDKVSEDTGVSKAMIMHLLREGRLSLDTPDGSGGLLCDICKTPINTGRMCQACKDKVANTMNKSIDAGKPPQPEKKDIKASKYSAKMHVGDLRNK